MAREDRTGQDEDSQLRRRRLNENKCRDRRLYDFIMREPCGPRFNCILVLCHTPLPYLSDDEPASPWKLKFQGKIKIKVTKTFKICIFTLPNSIACRFVCVFSYFFTLLNIAAHCILLQLQSAEALLASLRLRSFLPQPAAPACPQRLSTSPSVLHQTRA